ncbi:MAG: adenylosuccinate lyase, partial [Bacteroidales bacterium]
EGYPEPYEALKALTRTGAAITEETIHKFIEGLDLSDKVKNELRQIRPDNYLGIDFS